MSFLVTVVSHKSRNGPAISSMCSPHRAILCVKWRGFLVVSDTDQIQGSECCAQHTSMHIVVVEALLIAIYLDGNDAYIHL